MIELNPMTTSASVICGLFGLKSSNELEQKNKEEKDPKYEFQTNFSNGSSRRLGLLVAIA